MVRGNCKATINSNYTDDAPDAAEPDVPNQPIRTHTPNFNPFMGEIDGARDGRGRPRLLRRPRGLLRGPAAVHATGRARTTASAAARSTSGIPRVAGPDRPERRQGRQGRRPHGARRQGRRPETGPTAKTEQGILGIALDPDFTNGRPYIYVSTTRTTAARWARNTGASIGPGFVRADYMAERRLSRFTYNETTKTLMPGSEQDHPPLHDPGLLLLPPRRLDGLRLAGQPVLRHRRQHGQHARTRPTAATPTPHPKHTIPCPGDADVYVGDGLRRRHVDPDGTGHSRPNAMRQAPTSARSPLRLHQLRRRAPDLGQHERVRRQAAAHQADGANPGNARHRDDLHRSRAPTRRTARTCSRRTARRSLDGKAKPEVFAMGVRNLYSIDVDAKTDKISAAWVGPDQGTNSTTWGPAKTENAVLINSAGNYGWPYCRAQPPGLPRQAPVRDGRRPRRRTARQRPRHGRRRRPTARRRRRLLGLHDASRSPTTRRSTPA